jgi:hypothetical protein
MAAAKNVLTRTVTFTLDGFYPAPLAIRPGADSPVGS